MSERDPEHLLPWRVLGSELVLDNRWARVRKDSCALPDGGLIPDYYYWEGGDFAIVFALTAEQEVLLVRQYRHGAREITIELPAGLVDTEGESPLQAAQRELLEETGYSGGEWKLLRPIHVSTGKSTTQAFVFLARGLRREGPQQLEDGEDVEVMTRPLKEFATLVTNGAIHDAPSLAAAFLAMQVLQGESALSA